jgi:hypothetical protein
MLTKRQFQAQQRRGRKRILLAPKGQKHIRQAEQAALIHDQLRAEMAARRK